MDKKFYYLIISLVVASVLIFLLSIRVSMTGNAILHEQTIFASLRIADYGGFDANGTALTFGTIMPGGSSTRKITFANSHSFPVIVEFSVVGDIADFMYFEPAIYLEPGEEKEIEVGAFASEDDSFGNYSGNFYISMKRGV